MATIRVFNNDTYIMETYTSGESDPMPYITGGTLRVREFRGSSRSDLLWTEKRAMQAWNRFRALYGRPIHVGFAFRLPSEGGHSPMSQHYAGLAFDVGQNLNDAQRAELRDLAITSGIWSYVDPAWRTPRWVHFDQRRGVPACGTGGYPMQSLGSVGAYVLVLQQALNTLGFATGGLSGMFGEMTERAVVAFQRDAGLMADGVVECLTWTALMGMVVG
ncbi:MAG: peptidoglycan-binding protein [Oscillospiraceae bacterium]|nr:peptidoglycan-binding protein [Oscillospiraceae bacterium]